MRNGETPPAEPRPHGRRPPWVPRSGISGILWPAAATGRDAVRLALTYQLEQTQWWPSDAILHMQMRQLEHVVGHAYRTVPFYRHRLRAVAALEPGALTPEVLRTVPVLSRADIQEAGRALVSTRIPRQHGSTRDVRTSGSTGRPIEVKCSEVGDLFTMAINLRDKLWQRADFSGAVAVIQALKPAQEQAAADGKVMPWGPVAKSGAISFFDIRRPVSEQLAWLKDLNPDYLMTFPTNLHALVTRSRDIGISLPNLRHVMTVGEVLLDEHRTACKQAWGVEVVDNYSAAEVRSIALQCPGNRHYLVQSESLYVEILDQDGEPCAPGEIGRVVITDLHNFATPLIRYELGDFAEVGGPCPTGRGLPVLTRIVGRSRNMLTYPSGEQMWPSLPGTLFTTIAPVRQFQLTQTSRERIEVRLALAKPLAGEQEDRLREALQQKLGYRFELVFLHVTEIARSSGGKYEDFRSEIV